MEMLSEIGIIALIYRNNLNKSLTCEYLNRTKECFARAIEQYYAIKNSIIVNNKKGSYVEEYVFNQKITPLIENLLIKLKRT